MKTKNPTALEEAKRLYDLGFSILWIYPNSKRPMELGWTKGPKKTWTTLQNTFQPNFNLGVRLGSTSKIAGHYLGVIDVDIKSENQEHAKEAYAVVRKILKNQPTPRVNSGRGKGSAHFYILTEKPFSSITIARSAERVKAVMPSKTPSRFEIETLTDDEIQKGIRLSNAWEVSLYSEGRQTVLPPSVHPDTGNRYEWFLEATNEKDFLILPNEAIPQTKQTSSLAPAIAASAKFCEVEIEWLPISEDIRNGILFGKGISDRSAFLLVASRALLEAGLNRDEILSVLTNPNTFLGECAFEHAKTDSREKAAAWVFRYTLEKVLNERDPVRAFQNAPEFTGNELLSGEDAQKQNVDIQSERGWQSNLEKTREGRYRNTAFNCKMILQNVCSTPAIIGYDEFAINNYYLTDAPWGSSKGKPISDIDVTRIKFFCAENFGVEFGDQTIFHTLLEIADKNRFHPVRNWLQSLEWDGVQRISNWLKNYAGAVGPEPYLSCVSRKFLTAMVARVYSPGVKFDQVMILEGLQGAGKSSLLRKLVGDNWFSDAALNVGDKDVVLTMRAKWLLEAGELSAFNKAEVEVFKQFISQQVDRIRPPYGRLVEEYPRQCVIVGTTNKNDYLRDLTGNRRFWVVRSKGEIRLDEIEKDRDQLFAEAKEWFEIGEPLWLSNEEAARQAVEEQAERLQEDEWLPVIEELLPALESEEFQIKDVSIKMGIAPSRLTPRDAIRISNCLKMLGFEKYQRPKGERKRVWRRKQKSEIFKQQSTIEREFSDEQGI